MGGRAEMSLLKELESFLPCSCYKYFIPTGLLRFCSPLPYGNTNTVMTCRKTSERDSSPGLS
jgi:hypothetical protein